MSSARLHLQQQLRVAYAYLENVVEMLVPSNLFTYSPNDQTRTTGEIVLHIVRSLEYYLIGVTEDRWQVLPYSTTSHTSFKSIQNLMESNRQRISEMIAELDHDKLHKQFAALDHPTFGLNLMIELLYHQLEHFGQLQVYLRMNNLVPPPYEFLI